MIAPTLVPVGRCHQSLMRERFAQEESEALFGSWWASVGFGTPKVELADRATAAALVERYEWLGNLPDNCSAYAKLTFDGNTAGVVAFSRSHFGGSFSFLGHTAWKLTRGVTLHWAPEWASSFLVQRSLRLLFPEPVYVVAFSDWAAGEVGTIYQSCGWVYLGHKLSSEWVAPDGTRRDDSFHKIRAVSGGKYLATGRIASAEEFRRSEEDMLAIGWTRVRGMRGKYATVAGPSGKEKRELRAALRSRAQPYPKRAGGLSGRDAIGSTVEGEVRSLDRAHDDRTTAA